MRSFEISRHRACIRCGSHRLVKKKAGILKGLYTCKGCNARFSGVKLFRWRFSWY